MLCPKLVSTAPKWPKKYCRFNVKLTLKQIFAQMFSLWRFDLYAHMAKIIIITNKTVIVSMFLQ